MDDEWIRLCRLLDDDAELVSSVRLALADPDAFFLEHEERLRRSGASSSADVDPWLVLIDGLDDAGALAYLEPDDAGEELAEALGGVPRVVRAGLDLDPVSDTDSGLTDAIAVADAHLAPHGLQILFLDEGTEDWPLVVVPSDRVEEILSAAAGLGRTARVFP
ncbi:MAG: DUF6630 family protein [Microbacterium sp.]